MREQGLKLEVEQACIIFFVEKYYCTHEVLVNVQIITRTLDMY